MKNKRLAPFDPDQPFRMPPALVLMYNWFNFENIATYGRCKGGSGKNNFWILPGRAPIPETGAALLGSLVVKLEQAQGFIPNG
jgi:hypothetical protein